MARARSFAVDPRVADLRDDPARVDALRDALTSWFVDARRDLPWRRTDDAYAIWISEAMLQQTRVEAVLGHYARFLERFPTVRDLAAADEDEVVGMWSGLGYYNRARTLRRAALAIVDEHGGEFPDTEAEARALPGVGDYTTGAVLSIAYGRGLALVDGNVARVFARLFAIREPIDGGPVKRTLWELARILVPDDHPDRNARTAPGTWNQALMELGALVCAPRSPRCEECPLHDPCKARAQGVAEALPTKRPKRKPVDVHLEVLLARRGDEVLVVRRPADDRMARMWELPTRELLTDDSDETHLWPRTPHGPSGLVEPRPGSHLGTLAHGITHHRIRATLRAAEVDEHVLDATDPDSARWIPLADCEDLGLTGLSRKALRQT